MRLRLMTLAVASCLFSTLAFADNPTDAPLMPNDGPSVVQNGNGCKAGRGKKQESSAKADGAKAAKHDRKMKQSKQTA